MSNRRRKARRPTIPPCPDCASRLLALPDGRPFLMHADTCPSWRARTAALRAVVGDDVPITGYRWV